MQSIHNGLLVRLTIPDTFLPIPAEFIGFQRVPNGGIRLAGEGNFQSTILRIGTDGKTIIILVLLRLNFLGCRFSLLCHWLTGFLLVLFCFGFLLLLTAFRNLWLSTVLCLSILFLLHILCNRGLILLYRPHSHLVELFHDIFQIGYCVTHLLLQGACLLGWVLSQGRKITLDIGQKFLDLAANGVKQGAVLCRQLLHKSGILKNIRHGFCNHFPAGKIICKLSGGILCHFQVNQVFHIHPLLCEGIQYGASEFIILLGIPLFNKVRKFMAKCAEHGILGQLAHVLGIGQAGVDVNVNGIFIPLEFTLCPLKFPVLVRLGLVEYNVNSRSLRNGAEGLVSSALRVIECLGQIGNLNTFTLHNTLFPSGLSVRFRCIPIGLFPGSGFCCISASLEGLLSLSLCQIAGCLGFHGIRFIDAAFAHVVGNFIGTVKLRNILLSAANSIGLLHSPCLSTVFCREIFQCNSGGLRIAYICIGFLICLGRFPLDRLRHLLKQIILSLFLWCGRQLLRYLLPLLSCPNPAIGGESACSRIGNPLNAAHHCRNLGTFLSGFPDLLSFLAFRIQYGPEEHSCSILDQSWNSAAWIVLVGNGHAFLGRLFQPLTSDVDAVFCQCRCQLR